MANEKLTLLELSFDTTQGLNGLDEMIAKSVTLADKKKQLTAALKDEQAQLNKTASEYKAGTISQDDYKAAVDKSAAAQLALNKQVLATNGEISENNARIKANKTLLDAEASSVNALRAQLALNTKELNGMSEATKNNTDYGKNLVAETKALSDKLKDAGKQIGDNRMNVGAYSESIVQAITQTKGLGTANSQLIGGVGMAINTFKEFTTVLKANPILFVVGLVLSLVAGIEKLISRNSELSATMKAAFAPFEIIFARILDNVTSMITGLVNGIAWLSEKVTTFLSLVGLISEADLDAANQAKKLSKAQYDIYAAETANIVAVSEYRRELEAAKLAAADQTKSVKDRQAYLQKALAISKQIESAEIGVLQQKYEQIKAQNALAYSSQEDIRKEQQALADLNNARAAFDTQRKEVLGQMTGLTKTANDKAIADAKTAADKTLKAATDAKKKETEAYKTETEKQLKVLEQNLVQMDLLMSANEMGRNDNAQKLENQKAYNNEELSLFSYQLERKLITQQEYDNKILAQKVELAKMEEQLQTEQEQKNNERIALDAQNRYELQMQQTVNEFDQKQLTLDMQYQQELSNAEKIGADTSLIKKRYEEYNLKLSKERANAELSMAASLAGQLSGLLGEQSAAGKAFAIVQATINTYLGATKALADGGFWGIAQAALVIAAGLKNVMTISKQKEPETKVDTSVSKFAQGGTISGPSHALGGVTFTGSNGQRFEAEGGENVYILKRSASHAINALSALNESYGGRSFATSGLYRFAEGGQVAAMIQSGGGSSPSINSVVTLSPESINAIAGIVINSLMSMPNPVVSVQDINGVQANNVEIQNMSLM